MSAVLPPTSQSLHHAFARFIVTGQAAPPAPRQGLLEEAFGRRNPNAEAPYQSDGFLNPMDDSHWATSGTHAFLSPQRLALAAGLFVAGLSVPLLFRKTIGRWVFKGADTVLEGAKKTAASVESKLSNATEDLTRAVSSEVEFTQYNTFQNPILSTAILAVDPTMKPVVALYALVSVLGVLGGAFVDGVQETWVRSEETQIRQKALESLVSTYQQSISRKENLLQQLRDRTWNTVAGWLTEAGVQDVASYHPRWAGVPTADVLNKEHQKNYLLEPRPSRFSSIKTFGRTLTQQFVASGQPNVPTPPNNTGWVDALATVFPLGFGAVVGLLLSGASQTWGRLKAVIDSTTQSASKKSMVTSVVAYDLEALAAISKRLGTPALLLGYGLLVGAVGAGKSLINGVREIAVTQQNARTEVAFQRENWLNISTRMMLAAETAWTTNALQRFQTDLPYLRQYPQALRQKVHGLLSSIGFNSTPPHYLTSLGLTITEGARR